MIMKIIRKNEWESVILEDGAKPIKVIGTEKITSAMDANTACQAMNINKAPDVDEVILNPDFHMGVGVPIGSVVATNEIVYPSPVGVDIYCSMSLLQTNVPMSSADEGSMRNLMGEISKRIPCGIGKTGSFKNGIIGDALSRNIFMKGATNSKNLEALGINKDWAERCESTGHVVDLSLPKGHPIYSKSSQLGTYGGGNHFGDCCVTKVIDIPNSQTFGLKNECLSFLSHCGSRGVGFTLANEQKKAIEAFFKKWRIPFPSGDKELTYVVKGTEQFNAYMSMINIGANFAIMNHLYINKLIEDAFSVSFPGCTCEFIYHISHNFVNSEFHNNKRIFVHRKGATRALPPKHFMLKGTCFHETGHPILLPGNAVDGSLVMVATDGASKNLCSINHGAGRVMGRREAINKFNPEDVDNHFKKSGVLTMGKFPVDESPSCYKDFSEVTQSVELAGLASKVAFLKPLFVLNDS
jgi:tRNA-splicing ligase RtcB (3'-phosphate/5'-hydroxy nucleic acid ligase)